MQTGRRIKHRTHWDKVNTQQNIQHIPQFDENLALNDTTVESPLTYFKSLYLLSVDSVRPTEEPNKPSLS